MHDTEIKMKQRPHLVILGAGASVATIPKGDQNGRKISVMNGFLDKLEMRDIIEKVNLKTKSENLEDIYSELDSREDCNEVKKMLEEKIYNYFSEFEIPEDPTIYDLLILSLREKDYIATFNWDPLLIQAYQRARNITKKTPNLLFLHGNVAVGMCRNDNNAGTMGYNCPECNEPFIPTKLLYPVKEKNYSADNFLQYNWNEIRNVMKKAYIVTIFGYSAPKTDKDAIDLLKQGWGNNNDRSFEEVEIIDIRPENDLVESWSEFIHTHHYKVFNSFYDSTLAKFPRRTCDATFDILMNCKWLKHFDKIKDNMSFKELKEQLEDLLNQEANSSIKAYSIK